MKPVPGSIRFAACLLLAAACAVASAADEGVPFYHADAQLAALLDRPLTVAFDDVPLKEALKTLEMRFGHEGLRLTPDRGVELDGMRVTYHARETLLRDLLNDLLEPHGLAVAVREEDLLVGERERIEAIRERQSRRLHLATHPAGENAIELVWEINEFPPHDGSREQTQTAAFTGFDDGLDGKTFCILARRDDEETLRPIGEVEGPENRFLHEGVTPNRLYHYVVVASDANGRAWSESLEMPGATGENLLAVGDFESVECGPIMEVGPEGMMVTDFNVFRVVEGARPWSNGRHIFRADPESAGENSGTFHGVKFSPSPDQRYLQGAWLRAPGSFSRPCAVYFGRRSHERDGRAHNAFMLSRLSRTSVWQFGAQIVEPDDTPKPPPEKDHSNLSRVWTFPADTESLSLFYLSGGFSEADDLWLIEIEPAGRREEAKAAEAEGAE